MKDEKLLGKKDGATVNAQTDMTFQLSDDFSLDAYKPAENLEVGAGDVSKSLAVGASGAMEGAAEATGAVGEGVGNAIADGARNIGIPDTVIDKASAVAGYTPQGLGLKYVDMLGGAYGQAKEWLTDSLSDDGKKALQTAPVSEVPEGDWRVSSDPAVWAMQIAQGLGYMAPTVASAVATGGLSSASAIPSFTKLAMRSGAKPEVAARAAEKAYSVLRNTPASAIGMASDVGSQGVQAKETVMAAPIDQLAESEVFRNNFYVVDTDPEYAGLSDAQKIDRAREMTAEQASKATMSDEKTLATSAMATMLGDVPLANMLTRGAGKASSSISKGVAKGVAEGAVREGATEAIQGGTQQYVANEVSNEYAGTDLDPMDGVALGAVNEGVLGSAIGGTMGAAGGARAGAGKVSDTADAIENDMAQPAEPEGNTQDTDDAQVVEDVQGMEGAQLPSNDETTITDGPSEAAERVRQQILDKALSESKQEKEKPEVDGQGSLTSRFKTSQQSLRDKGVLPDNDNHFVKTVKLAYAMNQDKADDLLGRIEQGDQEAEQSLYALAEQASELGLDETGVQRIFNDAAAKQQAVKDKRESKVQRYISAIEQGRDNVGASKGVSNEARQPETAKDQLASSSERSAGAAEGTQQDTPSEASRNADLASSAPQDEVDAAYQQRDEQHAIQESIKDSVDKSAQSRGEFANRPNTMKMREDGKKPIADYAAITKKTKLMRKRLKKRMAQSNPQLREALLESLRNAPERIAAFEREANERKARFDAQPENQARRQQAEALFEPQQAEPGDEPDFARNAIKQVMDEMRERGEPIIRALPKEEQAKARADLKKAQSFATTKLRMMMDEAKAGRKGTFSDFEPRLQRKNEAIKKVSSDNAEREGTVSSGQVSVGGLDVGVPIVSREVEQSYNRATHIGRGRDFNAELQGEAKQIATELNEQGLLDTEARRNKAKSLIESYLGEQKQFIERESSRATNNPSWLVTGRSGRNMAKYSAKVDKDMAAFSREVEKLSAMRKLIPQQVEAVMNEEQRQAKQEKARRDNLSRAEKKAAEYLAIIAQNMREGNSLLAKGDRKWAGPKALTHLNLLASADEARAKTLAKKMEESFKDVGGVLKVAGPRSKLAARLKELLSSKDNPKNSPATPTENSAIPTLDAFSTLNKGDMSLTEIKALSEQLTRDEQGVKDELYSLTIPKINEKMGAYFAARWKGEKKDRIVQAAFDQLLSDLEFTMAGGAQTITLTQEVNGKTRAEKVNEKIQAMDEGTYQAFIDARKQAEKDRKEATKQRKAALKDPQTISDFNLFVQNGGKFTPELRARYDKLVTDETLSRRKSEQEAAAKKAGLEADGEIEVGDITEGTHGKTGATIFNVSLETRLGKDKFKEAAGMARSMKGGYWRGNFYFPTREDAEIFMGWLQGNDIDRSESVSAKREEKRQSNAEKLREASEKLAEKANAEYNAERKENTAKRMAEGERARSRAKKDAETAVLMVEVAEKIESGDLSALVGINAKTQVETLKRIENGLLWEASKKNSDAVERGDFSDPVWKEGTAIDEKVMFAKYPMADTDTRVINELASRMVNEKGYVKSGKVLLDKYKSGEPKDVALSTENEHVIKMVEFAKKEELYGDLPAMFQRLQRMGITRRELLRQALREMGSTKTKTGLNESKVAKLERELKKKVLGNRNAFVDFFPTPESRARHIIELADIEPGMKVLEPSAGNGMLADAAKSQGADVEVVELASDLSDILKEKGHKVVGNDFLAFRGKGYDRIVMNPPFSNDMDIDHVRHAYGMLKPGGKMVAVMSSMAGERSNNKNRAFKDWLAELDATEEMDPEGTFKESMNQTGVRTKTVEIEKPLTETKKENESEAVMFSREGVTQDGPSSKGMPLKQAELGVRQWLKEYNGGAGIKTKVLQTQEEAEKLLGQSIPGATIHGFYSDRDGAVVLVADNLPDMKTLRKKLRHEVLAHHGLKAVVGDSEYQKILERIARGKNSPHVKELWDRIEKHYGDQEPLVQVEEILAHAAEIERSTIQRWWDRTIEAIAHALRKVGFMRPHDITKAELNNIVQTLMDRVKAVNHWDTNNPPPSGGSSKLSQAKFSIEQAPTMDEVLSQMDTEPTAQGRMKRALSATATAVKGALGGSKGLGAVSLRQLADLAHDKLPQIKTYVDTVHRMMERRNQMAFESADIAQNIRKWAAKNKPVADELFNVAHEATVEGVDPAEQFVSAAGAIENRIRHIENVAREDRLTNSQAEELRQLRNDLKDEPRRLRKHIDLRKRFDKLPKEAKQHYRTMRDNYKARHNDYRTLLEQQIENADIDNRVKKKRLAELRSLFELQEVNAPYFPLARFGDYWVSAIDENGENRFLMFESEAEQKATSEKLKEKGFEVRSGYKMEGNPAINGASLSFVTDLMGKIDESSLNDEKKALIKDQVYQMYLQALPSRSMRKQFIHRKKTKGWSNDALRAMAENMMKGAYQLSRMEFADELTKQATEAKKVAEQSNDNQTGRYAEEMMKRHEWVMNPKHSIAAQKITSLGFLWMLGVSPAAAAVNTTQNFVVALPIIASKFGTKAAASELNGAMKEFITSRGQISRKFRNQSEKDAYQAWHDMGLLDSTNAHDLAGMAEAENWQYNETYEKAMGVVSWLFHKAEVFNRETTAIAAYRLAKQKGHSHESATKMAADITWDAHFDYTNANRARYMQTPTMKVLMQFKQYSQNMTYYLLRNMYLSMKGATKEEKAEARKQLVGTLGMTGLLGGATALPLGSLFALANGLNAAFGDDDEPWDAEVEFKNYLGELMGQDMGDKVIYGVGGAGVSSRISLDGLWIRDPNRDIEGEDLWTHYAEQVAGPVMGGIVVSWLRGSSAIAEGNVYRGIEKMMPKFARDPMKAYRYWDEGALNYRGDAYKEADQFTGLQLLLQANGLTDGELMKQYDLNNAIKGYEQHILDRRRDLMTAFWLAYKEGDDAMMAEAKRGIRKFNQANPRIAIDGDTLRRSIKTRRRYNQESQNGVNVKKSLRYLNEQLGW